MTTTLMTTLVAPVRPFAATVGCVGVTAAPSASRLRAAVLIPSEQFSVAVTSSAVPAIDGNWSRGRDDFGMANYGKTINAQAAKHGKAVDPPRGTSV